MAVRNAPLERYAVAVMGRSGVGKSAITVYYTKDHFVQEYDPTIEDLHLKHTTVGGAPACLEILDTAGQEAYSTLHRSWMAQGAGFLFVFSLVDRRTFDELVAFRDELMDLYHSDPPPSVLVANKTDIDKGMWVVQEDEIQGLVGCWRNCTKVVYTSAQSGSNIAVAFEALCLAVREKALLRRQAAWDREASARRELSASRAGHRCRLARCVADACSVL